MSLLKVANLKIQIGKAEPVRDVSFEIQPGEILGFAGESGSGKSLTSLSLIDLLPENSQVSGEFSWKNKSVSKTERQNLRGRSISMIFQDPMGSLNPSYNIEAQIHEVLEHRQNFKNVSLDLHAETLRLLTQVGISAPEKRLKAYPHQLSGGLCQRVGIALALAAAPDLLIADEPTTALDVTIQMQILELIYKLAKETKMAVIFVTHDLAVASRICDRVMILYAGQSVELDSAQTIFSKPNHPYTKALLTARPRLGQTRLQAIAGRVPSALERVQGCVFADRCLAKDKVGQKFSIFNYCKTNAPVFQNGVRCFLNKEEF